MARCYALDFQVLRSVTCEFEDFCGQIFEDCGDIDGGYQDKYMSVHRWRGGNRVE